MHTSVYWIATLHTSVYWILFSTTDMDECADDTLNECHENGDCNNTIGSYDCMCTIGYTGDGFNCSGTYVHLLDTFSHVLTYVVYIPWPRYVHSHSTGACIWQEDITHSHSISNLPTRRCYVAYCSRHLCYLSFFSVFLPKYTSHVKSKFWGAQPLFHKHTIIQ